jgi:hypothetical protein
MTPRHPDACCFLLLPYTRQEMYCTCTVVLYCPPSAKYHGILSDIKSSDQPFHDSFRKSSVAKLLVEYLPLACHSTAMGSAIEAPSTE